MRLFSADSIEHLRATIVGSLPQIIAGFAVIVAFWLAAVLVRAIVSRVARSRNIQSALVRLLSQSAYLGVLTLGLINGLGTMGVDVAALVAGLGLTGFALGFALKDIISNLLAGVLVILYNTFSEGDRVKVSGFEGRVVRVDLRYTLLDTGSDVVFLPNQLLFNNPVVVVGTEANGNSEAASIAK